MRLATWLLFPATIFLCAPVRGQQPIHYYYAASTVHIPLLQNRRDGDLGVGYGWGSKNTAFEARGVYSPVRNGALMVSYYSAGSNAVENEIGTKFSFADASLGAYQAFQGGSASLFAGVGQGRLRNNYGADKYSRFTLRRWFVQPSVAFAGKYFRAGMALRLSRLYYPKGESAFDINGIDLAAIRKIEKDSPFFLPELGLSGSVVMRPFFVSINFGSIFPDADGLQFSRFNVNVMLSYDLGTIAGLR